MNNTIEGQMYHPSHGSISGYDHMQEQKKMEIMQAMAERAGKGMKSKFDKIADLFEMDVLSEDEALKACKTVIQQHAKKSGKARIDIDD